MLYSHFHFAFPTNKHSIFEFKILVNLKKEGNFKLIFF